MATADLVELLEESARELRRRFFSSPWRDSLEANLIASASAIRRLTRAAEEAHGVLDAAVMADDEDGKGWRLLLIDENGEPARLLLQRLRNALEAMPDLVTTFHEAPPPRARKLRADERSHLIARACVCVVPRERSMGCDHKKGILRCMGAIEEMRRIQREEAALKKASRPASRSKTRKPLSKA